MGTTQRRENAPGKEHLCLVNVKHKPCRIDEDYKTHIVENVFSQRLAKSSGAVVRLGGCGISATSTSNWERQFVIRHFLTNRKAMKNTGVTGVCDDASDREKKPFFSWCGMGRQTLAQSAPLRFSIDSCISEWPDGCAAGPFPPSPP